MPNKFSSILTELDKIATQLEEKGLETESSALHDIFIRLASEDSTMYFQRQKTRQGKYIYRGIIEHVDPTTYEIKFLPEKPLIAYDLDKLKADLKAVLPGVTLTEKGMSEPWHPESNMPFDMKGNRLE